jgi:hypothetical protein
VNAHVIPTTRAQALDRLAKLSVDLQSAEDGYFDHRSPWTKERSDERIRLREEWRALVTEFGEGLYG